jgi:hypothetical protein
MKNFKATLFVGTVEIDYMIFESENLKTAGEYTDKRFDNAYPQFSNREDAKIEIEELN